MYQPLPEVSLAFNGTIFSTHFIDSKALYLYHFKKLPSITVVRQVDHDKVWQMLHRDYKNDIREAYHYSSIASKKLREEKEESIVLIGDEMLLEIGDGYCEFYYSSPDNALRQQLIAAVSAMRGKRRSKPQEINLITKGDYGLELTKMDVKRTSLKLDLFYEDDFAEVHNTIMKRLGKKDDKGIVLLHGLPGTGKTTYLRYLAGKIKKRVLFIPPDMAAQIANPELIRLLVDHPNSVLIIEDAESVIMQRQPGSDSAVSNLLNISDGLLSDFLNVQIVCTFNSSKAMVDSALTRKGRLIASYEFGKLSQAKAQKLSQHMGHHSTIHEPMTLTEIMNQKERSYEMTKPNVIGFRRA